MNKNFNKKGFTIIEVVLVLAIAGLIFLMVFVALPNLQKSQRDTTRKNNYALIVSAITSYISDHNTMPTGMDKLENYLGTEAQDPQGGNPYTTLTNVIEDKTGADTYTEPTKGEGSGKLSETKPILIFKGGTCDGKGKKGARHYALWGYVEAGDLYCSEN